MEASNLSALSKDIILLYTVHWLPRSQHRCCRASRELCSNDLFSKL